jgi:ribonuclease HII
MIVGVDEAGRGPLAGSVVACALHLPLEPEFMPRDSKLLSAPRREEMFQWLSEHADFAIEVATAREIDDLNIFKATLLAFNRAIERLLRKKPCLREAEFIIDGTHFDNVSGLKARTLIGADKKIKEVSCASIMAKVFRDFLMKELDFLCPQWNFSKHKGYPTKEHFSLIKRYNISAFHRRSFSLGAVKKSLLT